MFPQGAMHTFNVAKYPQSSHILQRYIVANANVGHSEGVVGREVGTQVSKGDQSGIIVDGQLIPVVS